jgi:phage tail-like protein
MTQTRDLLPLSVRLTPMQLPQVIPQRIAGRSLTPEEMGGDRPLPPLRERQATSVTVHPGEPSELLVQLENYGDVPLRVDLSVEGDFPATWCRLHREGDRIEPGRTIEAVLYFQVRPDFFESAIVPPCLDYRGCLYLTCRRDVADNREPPRQDTAAFDLYIRPRSLYLDFLPELYREVDFIGRLLNIFEQTFEPAVQTLDALWAYLNPLTAPEALLPFLAHWVGWRYTSQLESDRQRYSIARALELYAWRGTRRGLRYYLHLFTGLPLDEDLPEADKTISIQEVFGRGFLLGETHIGRDAILGGTQPFHFIVVLRPPLGHSLDETLIREIVEQEKPAFCTYELYIDPIQSSSPIVPTARDCQ